MGVVLDDGSIGVPRHGSQALDVAADTGIVDRHDSLDPLVQYRCHALWVEAERLGLDVGEADPSPGAGKGKGRRYEGEGRDDHDVIRSQVKEKGGHLQGVGARRREKDVGRSQLVLQQVDDLCAERPPGRDVSVFHGREHEVQLVTLDGGPVKRDPSA